jgi:hypothetical protein
MLEQTAVSRAARYVSLSWNGHFNMVGWANYISGMSAGGNTLYEYPGTCTCKIQYFAMYQMYSGGERSLGDSDRCYLRREVCTRACTTL